MREYVRLPEQLLADTPKRVTWIRRSLVYALNIEPKPKKRALRKA